MNPTPQNDASDAAVVEPSGVPWGEWPRTRAIAFVLLVSAGCWAYVPAVMDLARIWMREADYSHGFLVFPLSLLFLWVRRDQLRGVPIQPAVAGGLFVLAVSLVVRYIGLRYALYALDGYSLALWCGSLAILFLGWVGFQWALPSILFLFFMVPLPFQMERLLSVPLQRVATALSSFLLQCLGQPAFAEGTTILLGSHQLLVEQACSGLRMFVSAFALAFAYLVVTKREYWEQAILLVSVVPIALLANAIRIVITGLLYQTLEDGQRVQQLSHDFAGVIMIPMAALMFGGVLFYLSRLVQPVESVGMSELVLRGRAEI